MYDCNTCAGEEEVGGPLKLSGHTVSKHGGAEEVAQLLSVCLANIMTKSRSLEPT